LLQILGCMDPPTSGKLFIDGNDVSRLTEKERTILRRRKLGFIFQNYQLFPTMTVFENVAFPMLADNRPKSEVKDRVKALLQAVDLADKIHFFPSSLSGGQQQRVAIARALAMNPRLILADEPTGNLDRKRGREILELLSHLHREEKLTIVMVTHDLFAAGFSDRIILLKDGLISEVYDGKEGKDDAVMAHLLEKLNS